MGPATCASHGSQCLSPRRGRGRSMPSWRWTSARMPHCCAAPDSLSPWLRFIKFYFLRLGFLDGLPGLVHILIGCSNSFIKHAKIRDIQNRQYPLDNP